MAAAPSRSRARWPAPAARRSSSPPWMKRASSRAALPSGRDLCARRLLPELPATPTPRSTARPVIGDLNELAEWDVFCRRSGWAGGAAIHIDTGMNRLGLTVAEAQGIIPRINAGDHGITLVMSHLACAETLNIRSTPSSSRPSARSPACFPACRPRCRIRPAFSSARHSSSTWCGREPRSTASIRRRRPTIRCSRWSS